MQQLRVCNRITHSAYINSKSKFEIEIYPFITRCISSSFIKASTGVKVFTSRLFSVSRIFTSTGSSILEHLHLHSLLLHFADALFDMLAAGAFVLPVSLIFRWHVPTPFEAYPPVWLHGYRSYARCRPEPACAEI